MSGFASNDPISKALRVFHTAGTWRLTRCLRLQHTADTLECIPPAFENPRRCVLGSSPPVPRGSTKPHPIRLGTCWRPTGTDRTGATGKLTPGRDAAQTASGKRRRAQGRPTEGRPTPTTLRKNGARNRRRGMETTTPPSQALPAAKSPTTGAQKNNNAKPKHTKHHEHALGCYLKR